MTIVHSDLKTALQQQFPGTALDAAAWERITTKVAEALNSVGIETKDD